MNGFFVIIVLILSCIFLFVLMESIVYFRLITIKDRQDEYVLRRIFKTYLKIGLITLLGIITIVLIASAINRVSYYKEKRYFDLHPSPPGAATGI